MICGACNQDRHPVIEGDQNGRFVYTCGNGECHAFIKLHERSEPAVQAQPVASVDTVVLKPRTPAASQSYVERRTVDEAVCTLELRLGEVDAVLATVPALKAEQKRLHRMLAAAKPKAAAVTPIRTYAGQTVGYSPAPKAHQ